jgi:hypothetical protein
MEIAFMPRTAFEMVQELIATPSSPGALAAGRLPSCSDLLVGMRTHSFPVCLSNKTQKALEKVLFR